MATHSSLRNCAPKGAVAELIDAREVGSLPILDRMYKEYPAGAASHEAKEANWPGNPRRGRLRVRDRQYTGVPQAGPEEPADHFLEEWFWRPAALVSYSPGRLAGVRASSAWHPILSEMGMAVVIVEVPWRWARSPILSTRRASRRVTRAGWRSRHSGCELADDLAWWTSAARLPSANGRPRHTSPPTVRMT